MGRVTLNIKNLLAKMAVKTIGTETLSNFLGVLSGGSMRTIKRGTPEMLKAYSMSPWVRAVVDKISYSMASTVWRVYVKRNAAGKAVEFKQFKNMAPKVRKEYLKKALRSGELQEIETHPMLDLLYAGNPYMTSHDIAKLRSIYLELTGEYFALKQRNGLGVPTNFWPIPNNWIIEKPTLEHPIVRIRMGNNTIKEFPAEDLVWFKNPDPVNPYIQSSGVGMALGDEIDSDEYASIFIKSYFQNGGRPDLLVFADGLDRKEVSRLEERYQQKSRGFMKAGPPMFLNRKIEVQDISRDFKDLELIKLRSFERDTLIHTFGVPPELIGVIENSNRATITAADYLFSRYVLTPRLEQERIYNQERLASEFDDRIIVDYDSPVESDKEFELEVAKAFPWAYETDEIRHLAGMEPFGDSRGKERAIPFNTTLTSSSTEQTPPPESRSKSTTKALRGEDIETVLSKIDEGPFVSFLIPALGSTAGVFGQEAINSVGSTEDFIDSAPVVESFVRDESLNKVNLINNTTKEDLRGLLLEATTQGVPTQTLARQISDRFSEIDNRRAKLIARTESLRVANFATKVGFEQVGVTHKGWLSSRDSRVREAHTVLDGKSIPINELFISPATGASGSQPGGFNNAADDIQCRCTITAEQNAKGLDTEEKRVEAWKAFDSLLSKVETKVQEAVSKAFNAQRDAVLNEIGILTNEQID